MLIWAHYVYNYEAKRFNILTNLSDPLKTVDKRSPGRPGYWFIMSIMYSGSNWRWSSCFGLYISNILTQTKVDMKAGQLAICNKCNIQSKWSFVEPWLLDTYIDIYMQDKAINYGTYKQCVATENKKKCFFIFIFRACLHLCANRWMSKRGISLTICLLFNTNS